MCWYLTVWRAAVTTGATIALSAAPAAAARPPLVTVTCGQTLPTASGSPGTSAAVPATGW